MGDYESTGVVRVEDIKVPSEDRLEKGPVVIIECVENIPCNPCVAECPQEAISMEEITDIPDIDFKDCIGCGLCVTECPGLAIFLLDCSYSEDKCKVTVPYEYLPVPEVGEEVKALDREGDEVQRAEVTNVRKSGRTYAVTIEIDRENAMTVRGVEVIG